LINSYLFPFNLLTYHYSISKNYFSYQQSAAAAAAAAYAFYFLSAFLMTTTDVDVAAAIVCYDTRA
jgi:hypothetical protein